MVVEDVRRTRAQRMFKSYRIGSLLGIPIKLDVTLLVILPIFAWLIAAQIELVVPFLDALFGLDLATEALTTGSTPWLIGGAAAVGLFVSVLLHELGHSVVAIRYGFPIDSITLWLLGGVAQLTEQPTDWRQELLIAIAGPIVSVGIGVACYLLVGVTPPILEGLVAPVALDGVLFVLAYLSILNVALAAFNMLPGFPMDGGRVLRALLARNRPFVVATRQAAQVGKGFAVLLGLLGLLAFDLILIAIAFFIYLAASAEARQTTIQAAIEGITVADIMTPRDRLDTVTPSVTIEKLLETMLKQRHTGYPVVEGGVGVEDGEVVGVEDGEIIGVEDGELVGVVTLEDVRRVPPDRARSTTVGDVMTTELETLEPDDDAMEALTSLQRNDVGRLPVLDEDGWLAGLITRSDVVRAFNVGYVRSAHAGVEAGPDVEPADAKALSRPPTTEPDDRLRW